MAPDFHWLRPEWFWALPVLALVIVALARRSLAPGNWQRIVDPALAPYVLSSREPGRHRHRWWLMGLGGLLAVLALAGPSWNRIEQPVFRSEQALVIALDLSLSMDAQDLSPTRLTRAKLKILDILKRRKSGQTALVVYSANAFTVTPLTTDTDTIAALVGSLSTDIMPSRGSYPATAIYKGQQLLQQAGVAFGEVLLITDGGTSPAAERAARELAGSGYVLSVMAVGTAQGAPIPMPGGGFVTDRSGQIAVPRLEAAELRRLASAGRGRFVSLSADDRDLEALLSGVGIDASQSAELQATDQWREEGPWLLLLLLPLAASAFRRGWVLAVVLTLLPFAEPAHAFGWDDLWFNKNQQAERQLATGDAAQAALLFQDPVWRAVANYRAGDYAMSADGFAAEDDIENRYNLGNALARLGQFESAIDAYERVLDADPEHEDARYNRDLLQNLLDQQDQSESTQGQNKDSSSQSGDAGQQADGEGDQEPAAGQDRQGDAGDESQAGDSSRGEEETNASELEAIQAELERAAEQAAQQQGQTEQVEALAERREQEQRQAMEQWLRRIPDDPGGLLRRKFRYQYQRMGRDQDGNNLWPDDEVQPW